MHQHEGGVPAPLASNHYHWRSREVRESAADRDIHKENSQRGVTKCHRGLERVEFRREKHRANRHRCGFGDERTHERADGEDGKPPSSGRARADIRDLLQTAFREMHDWARTGDRHDHHHEHRLGEIHP